MDLANNINRLKLILDIVKIIKMDLAMSKQTFLHSLFLKKKYGIGNMKQLTSMSFRRNFTTITRYMSEPLSETDDLIKY